MVIQFLCQFPTKRMSAWVQVTKNLNLRFNPQTKEHANNTGKNGTRDLS